MRSQPFEIFLGPKTSKPTFVKIGLVSFRSGRKFAKCCSSQLLSIYPGFYKAGYHSMSSNNLVAGLANCSASNETCLVMDFFVEVADDQLRYKMTFW